MRTTTFFILLFILFGCKPDTENFINTSDSIKMYYKSFGSNATTLVFIHGWSCDASAWDDQLKYFKDKYHVIALDLPGFGRSGKQRDQWSMQRLGIDVADLSIELDLNNIVLIGHSMGGPVALEAAKNLKEKVKGVILVDILQSPHYSFDTASFNWYNDYAENFTDFEYLSNFHKKDSLRTIRYMKMLPMGEVPPEPWLPMLIDYYRWKSDDLIPVISEIQIPIRALNSDQRVPKFEEWNLYHNNFDATIIENSGHYLNWEYPDKFNHSLNELIRDIVE